MGKCRSEGCTKPVRTRGYCDMHYMRLLRSGQIATRSKDPVERFWSHVDRQEGGCWLWTGSTSRGYGYVRTDGLLRPAHRVAYELVVGPIPEGLHLDHLCRQAVCCNPAHLEPVELRENTARGEHPSSTALRTNFCIHGHEYTPDNTYVWHGRRQCRECRRRSRRESARRAYRRRKDSSP